MITDTSKLQNGLLLDNRYKIIGFLKEGGFSYVYKAYDQRNKKSVIIKEFYLREYFDRDIRVSNNVIRLSDKDSSKIEKSRTAFQKEAQILSSVSEVTGVAKIIRLFEENDTSYIVLEAVQGDTIKEIVKTKPLIDKEAVVKVLIEILNVLSMIHRRGIIHADLSPDNIIITPDHTPVILDFGAAFYNTEELRRENITWTPGYAAYETYSKEYALDCRCDIYSVACIGYYMLTGIDPPDVLERELSDDITFPETIPDKLKALILRGMSLALEDRYADAESFSLALTRYMENDETNNIINKRHWEFSIPKIKNVFIALLLLTICICITSTVLAVRNTSKKNSINQIEFTFDDEIDDKTLERCFEYFNNRIRRINGKEELEVSFDNSLRKFIIIPANYGAFEEWLRCYPYMNHAELVFQGDENLTILPEYIEEISVENSLGNGIDAGYRSDDEFIQRDYYIIKITLNEFGMKSVESFQDTTFFDVFKRGYETSDCIGYLQLWITKDYFIKVKAQFSFYENEKNNNAFRVSFRYPKELLPFLDELFMGEIIPVESYHDNFQEQYPVPTIYDLYASDYGVSEKWDESQNYGQIIKDPEE